MKKYLFSFIVLSLLLAGPIYSAATNDNADPATDENAEEATPSSSIVPDSVPMQLDIKEGQRYVFPESYRGGDPDSTLVHVLEDVEYERHEHALIYVGDAEAMAKGAEFEDDPNIVWKTTKKNADGTWPKGTDDEPTGKGNSETNNNKATCTETMEAPGEYNICNSGARLTSEHPEEETGVGGTDEEMAETPTGDNPQETEGEGQSETGKPKTKTVPATQNLGVIVHDCTAPDIWVAFKEGAGKAEIDMYAEGNNLANELFTKMKVETDDKAAAEPFSDNPNDFEEVSYLFIDEGSKQDKERDKEPWNKTARVTSAGGIFNEEGRVTIESDTVNSVLLDEATQLRQVHVSADDDSKVKGIFVRRNVPFVYACASVDNGTERVQSTKDSDGKEIIHAIEKEDGTPVSKQDGAYLFRVANYPRESYQDQPSYFFVAKSVDAEGNITTIKLPLYIVNSNATFETTSK